MLSCRTGGPEGELAAPVAQQQQQQQQ